jgi:hypothetical protein
MNKHADKESLLAEVLAEVSPADFRATLLAETLRLARRRRHFRRARWATGVLVVISLLAVLMGQQTPKPTVVSAPPATRIVKQSYELVRTQLLPARALISTRTFSGNELAASAGAVVEITTTTGGFRLINDDELMALLADKPAVLIRTGPHSEELVFANPEDQKKFLVY